MQRHKGCRDELLTSKQQTFCKNDNHCNLSMYQLVHGNSYFAQEKSGFLTSTFVEQQNGNNLSEVLLRDQKCF